MPIYINPYDQAAPLGTPIGINQRVAIRIMKEAGLTATDGSTLGEDVKLVFYTEATPLYADVDYIIMNGGELLEDLPEAAIYLSAFAASTMVDDIVLFDIDNKFPDKTTKGYRFFNRARTEFVKCKAISDLMRAIISGKGTGAGRKALADFAVDDSAVAAILSQGRPMLKDYVDCYLFWQKVLFAGGAMDFNSPAMEIAVKAGHQPDNFGGIGRAWLPDSEALTYKEPETTDGNTTSRPRRFGYRHPLADWWGS